MQDARMLLPRGAWRRVLLRAGNPRVERLDAYRRALPALQESGRQGNVDNVRLAHRLCNRIDYSISDGRSYASDLKRIRNARQDAIRRNNEGPDALTQI